MISHTEPFIALHSSFNHSLPEGHRFPMIKYELLPEQLLLEGIVSEEDFFEPDLLSKKYLKKVHDSHYLQRLFNLSLDKKEIRRIGFPLSQELVDRELHIAQGTVTAAEAAFKRGIGFNIAGGTHHAGRSWGEGFCLLNDQAIAAQFLLDHYNLKQILIIDLDVHQGNGTANIFQNEHRVFTFSMHGKNNFPFEKEKSDWDVGLPDAITGKEYLAILAESLGKLPLRVQPEFIFFQAGVDVLSTDKMGKLNLEIENCRQRDILVFDFCRKWHLPVEVSMGGGYSSQIRDIVNAHCHTYKEGIAALLN